MEPSHGFGVAWLLAAKIVCCGALALAATRAISFAGISGWLSGSGPFWLAAAVLVVLGIGLWRWSARPSSNDVRKVAITHPLHGPHK